MALEILETPFEGRGSFVDWANLITIILAILTVILVVYVAFARRRTLPSATRLLGFLGLCVFPLFMMLFGNFATFEGGSKVSFCHSCHTAMDPYVEDMRDKTSTTLAAVHYKNRYFQEHQCYQCHADYGVAGTAKSKFRGLQHLYFWVTGSATNRSNQV